MSNIPAIYQGKLNTLDQIKVSPLSRAYTFSDSIYEVIPYFLGKPLCYKEHFDRMIQSSYLMGLDVDFDSVTKDIKELAKFSTKSNDNFGVEKVLEKLISSKT